MNGLSRGVKIIQFFKLRNFSALINIPNSFQLISEIESNAKNDIQSSFAKESMSPNQTYKLLKIVSEKMCIYCNNLTKSLLNDIWLQIHNKKIKVDAHHYNITLNLYLNNNIEFNPLDIIQNMNDNNITFNESTFDLLLKKYCQLGDYQSAMKLIDKMVQSDIFITGTMQFWLIGCAIRANKEEEIGQFYEEVKRKNLIITHATYAFIAEAYASQMDVENCIRMHQEAESSLGDHPKLLQYKYRSYFELAKHGADEGLLAKMLNFIDTKQDLSELKKAFHQLNRSRLFSAANFLIRNAKVELSEEDYKNLLKWLVLLQPPFEHVKFLTSKITDPSFHKFLIRYLSPFKEAFTIAERLLYKMEATHRKSIMLNLMINANHSDAPIANLKEVLNFFRIKLSPMEFHKYLINFGIDQLLTPFPDNSQHQLISTFTDSDDLANRNGIASCCIYRTLWKGELNEAKQLLERHMPLADNLYFKFHYRNFSYLLVLNRSIGDICERVAFIKTIMCNDFFELLLEYIGKEIGNSHPADKLEYFIKFCQEELHCQLPNSKNVGNVVNREKT